MPRIPNDVLNCTFYLYPSKQAAEVGENCGGTGFFVMTSGAGSTVYALTNWHVAVKGGNSVMRVNSGQDPPEIIEYDPSDWRFIARGDDLAALEFPGGRELGA
jgi:hypothetical protein